MTLRVVGVHSQRNAIPSSLQSSILLIALPLTVTPLFLANSSAAMAFLLPRASARLPTTQPLSSLLCLRSAFHPTPRSSLRTYSVAAQSTQPRSKPRCPLFALSATTTSLLLVHHTFSQRRLILCDTPANARSLFNDYTSEAKTPIITKEGKPNPSSFRQISGGSIIGLVGGLVIASFSKALVFLLGLGVLLVQVRSV